MTMYIMTLSHSVYIQNTKRTGALGIVCFCHLAKVITIVNIYPTYNNNDDIIILILITHHEKHIVKSRDIEHILPSRF